MGGEKYIKQNFLNWKQLSPLGDVTLLAISKLFSVFAVRHSTF
jgi:hypothetical protein